MAHFTDILLFPFKLTFICVLIAMDIFLVTLLLNSLQVLDTPLYAKNTQSAPEDGEHITESISKEIKHTTMGIGSTIMDTAKSVGNSIGSVAHTVSNTTSQITQGIATSVTQPETIIKPEPAYEIPKIESVDPPAPTVATSNPPPPQVTPAAPAPVSSPSPPASVWPLKGVVTTEFGTYHQPYQPRHTGIDISSHLPGGRASITPFREGVVIDVVRSSRGLGNHIIVDHGNGLTSCYAHLSSIAVNKGQPVRPGDILGYEGRTGAATGPHLHLEIRENGKPVNPRKYIGNNP